MKIRRFIVASLALAFTPVVSLWLSASLLKWYSPLAVIKDDWLPYLKSGEPFGPFDIY